MRTTGNIAGERFGRLVAIRALDERRKGHIMWECRCDCGKVVIRAAGYIANGNTSSCGCWRDDLIGARQRTHGKSKSATYRIWKAMRRRCNCPKDSAYEYYGGRSIKVCERWGRYENFLADMGERPPSLSIDRIDANGNYEPGNCRWATQSQQVINRRPIDTFGEKNPNSKLSAAQAAAIKGRLSAGDKRKEIARDFSVSLSLVNLIAQGRIWQNV